MLHQDKSNDEKGNKGSLSLNRSAIEIPKYELPEEQMTADSAYNFIHNELLLDGNAQLNLATFVTTWMEPQAEKLMSETFDKNMIDKDEYPQTAEIEKRCVNIITRLFNGTENSVGSSAIGSSEAVMLAGMAFKRNWVKKMKKAGKPSDRPNMVLGSNVQVVWEKFCRYWDVEPKYIPMKENCYTITPEDVIKYTDENTIAVVAILGTTYTGVFEPIKDIHDAMVENNKKTGWDTPLHIDAASGGFVAPFLHPELEWDFRLPLVKSINVSGHKYGLVYPGVGWIVWRDKEDLPEELVFHVNYLGGDMPTFTLNFSRPANQIIGQYYNFLRLGRKGYTNVMTKMQATAMNLSKQIVETGYFELLSDGSEIPVFTFKVKDEVDAFTAFNISDKLRERGWQVPAYSMPADVEHIVVLRVVVRESFNNELASILLQDIKNACAHFISLKEKLALENKSGFAH